MKFTYNDLYKKLINQHEQYNLYFGIILLAKLAKIQNVPKSQFDSDLQGLKQTILASVDTPSAILLDIEDGRQAYTNIILQRYDSNDLFKLMEDCIIEKENIK